MLVEIGLLLLLTLLNGVLAMAELAIVSARRARLRHMAGHGVRGAAAALRLARAPGRFLSAVQIGITLVGVLAGAFSGTTLGVRLAGAFGALGVPGPAAEALGVGVAVVAATYLSLVLGELVPKRIALGDPENVAARLAPAMTMLSRATGPAVGLLDASSRAVLRLIGSSGRIREGVSEEEVRSVIDEAETAGIIEHREREMMSGVMRLADRTARALMTPRRDVEVLDMSDDPRTVLAQLGATPRSRLPVRDGGLDEIVGVVVVREALAAVLETGCVELRPHLRQVPVVLDGADALSVVERLRVSKIHLTLVFDEYGHFEGIVTPMDVLEAIAGSFRPWHESTPAVGTRADGSLLVSGSLPVDEFAEYIGITLEPGSTRDYETLAGLVLDRLGHLPEPGESVEVAGWRLEVVALQARRIDKVRVLRITD